MDPVQEQYEAYPYPARNPADEDKRLITGSPSALREIDHYLYAGARDWSQPFRVLFAGGGTGDALIMLAQQLADEGCPADITYLDLSKASRAIAQARAERRGLTSIRFETASLLEAAKFGPFDYIDCCGVLHHLPEPVAGFQALKEALAPDGGMGIMLYGALGRSGVYDVQSMLRTLMNDGDALPNKVEITRRLLNSLPDTNRLKRNPFLTDHQSDDAGLYDLLLHSRDRAYRVSEVYDLLDQAELDVVSFVAPANYDPDFVIADPKLKARVSRLTRREREAFAELLTGNLKKHTFYCAHKENADASRIAQAGPHMKPYLHETDLNVILPAISAGKAFAGRRDGLKLELPMPPLAADILKQCDGAHTLEDIRQALTPQPARGDFYEQAQALCRAFNSVNLMLLRQG